MITYEPLSIALLEEIFSTDIVQLPPTVKSLADIDGIIGLILNDLLLDFDDNDPTIPNIPQI